MNRIDRYQEAERLLGLIGEPGPSDEAGELMWKSVLVQLAQVNATLAAVDVDLDRQARQATAYRKLCGCSFLPDPHIEGASCPPVGPPRAERVLPPGYRPQYAAGWVHKTLCTQPGGHLIDDTECPLPTDEQSGVTWKDCTLDGVPIPNTDGTPNKYAEPNGPWAPVRQDTTITGAELILPDGSTQTMRVDPDQQAEHTTPKSVPSDGPGQ